MNSDVLTLSKLPSYQLANDIRRAMNDSSDSLVKLCSNESPLGANPRIINTLINKLNNIYLYPDVEGFNLKYAISQQVKIPIDNIILGNGSSEILDLITQANIMPGSNAIMTEFGYPLYEFLVKKMGATIIKVPVKDWQYDLDGMLKRIDNNTKIIFLTNPNNPTGSWITYPDLSRFLEKVNETILVVLDEAYYEFLKSQTEYSSGINLLNKHRNLIVVRTFSKAYGLAGIRIGYAAADPQLIHNLVKVKQSANVNILAQFAAIEAIHDQGYVESVISMVQRERESMMAFLAEQDIQFLPTLTNFLLINLEKPAITIYNHLRERNIFVHPMDFYQLPNFIRVSIGTEINNRKFMSALHEVLHQ